MTVFGHHTKAYLEVEAFGYDLTPETGTEHAVAVALVVVTSVLMVYGAYALVRDLFGRRRTVS
jgi:hypothetical protein